MASFNAHTLQKWSGGSWHGGREPEQRVRGFTQDSRQLAAGMCFVALKTGKRDGHDFLPAALEAGAAMALVTQGRDDCPLPQLVVAEPLQALQTIARCHRETFDGTLIGVTGSCGKTSTKNILQTLLGADCHATIGNLNNFIGVPLTLLGLDPHEHDFAVVEAGISEPGEMDTLAQMIRPDIALVTMVGPAHLENLGDVAGVAEQKLRLAQGFCVKNRDSAKPSAKGLPYLPTLFAPLACWEYPAFAALPNVAIAVVPVEEMNRPTPAKNVGIHCYSLERGGRLLRLEGPFLSGDFPLGFVPSAGMASNIALALLAAYDCGVEEEVLAARLLKWKPQDNRGQWLQAQQKNFWVDCYNANPASMMDALDFFAAHSSDDAAGSKAAARLYVLGGMRELGADSALWHQRVGEALGSKLRRGDQVLLVGAEGAGYLRGLKATATSVEPVWVEATAQAQACVDAFCGEVFLKGSRYYALEALLPS